MELHIYAQINNFYNKFTKEEVSQENLSFDKKYIGYHINQNGILPIQQQYDCFIIKLI
jgi:hypothetical protein